MRYVVTSALITGLILPIFPVYSEMPPSAQALKHTVIALEQETKKTPSQRVTALYHWLLQHDDFSPVVHTGYLSHSLLQKLKKVLVLETDISQPFLDFDPFSDSQMKMVGFKIIATKIKKNKAWVTVQTELHKKGGTLTTVTLILEREKGIWVVSNIQYQEGGDLQAILDHIIKAHHL